MAQRRRYTQQERAEFVAEATINGTEAAAGRTGIPESTGRYGLDKPEFAELRAKTRDEMRDGFKVLVHRVQEALMGRVGEMEPRDLTILLGVATDKTLLMSGDATGRTETRSLASGLDDHERAALKRVLVDELARRQDRERDPGVGVDAAPASDSA
jgi:hypothetical protein